MYSLTILALITGFTLLGDYCIKLASGRPDGLATPIFWIGALLYGLPAIGWFYLMRSHSLATLSVFYSSSTIVLMAALGVLVFREGFGWREGLGVTLAVISVLIVSGGGEKT